ncbi:MAG: hypothetical protein M3N38_11320 [Pseudomonadota bacterium]|nr:hypothetical protein [Pseudomonadota bacterium]
MTAADARTPVTRGVVYACSHPAWFREAMQSAASCRRHMPGLACEIYLPRALHDEAGDRITPLFSKIVALDDVVHMHRPRFEAMQLCQLDEALFLDCDTLFLGPVEELFDVLRHFEMGITPAPQQFSHTGVRGGVYDLLPPVSTAVPEWNGGFILARVTEAFRSFARTWSTLFESCRARGYHMDQAALRSAVVTSSLRSITLPVNYNFRANFAQSIKGPVKVLHAHGELYEIAKSINETLKTRFYQPDPALIHGFKPKELQKAR